jgi:hypothetical protein
VFLTRWLLSLGSQIAEQIQRQSLLGADVEGKVEATNVPIVEVILTCLPNPGPL